MNVKDFKAVLDGYNELLPIEYALGDLMFRHKLKFLDAVYAYIDALEKERHIQNSRFCEASISLTQMLGGNFKGKHKEEMLKRAVHTFNLTTNLPRNIHNEKYGYTEEDKRYWDERMKELYGVDLDLMNKEEEKK